MGLYRDDGLGHYLRNTLSGPQLERLKKDVIKFFKDKGFAITIEFRLHKADFLDVTFDLTNASYVPYRKPNDVPTYVHRLSNHPPAVIKQLPAGVEKRLCSISHSRAAFNEAAPLYQGALKKSGYEYNICFKETQPEQQSQNSQRQIRPRKRTRKVTWYNPPFSQSVTTNIGKEFLGLIDKHFPPQRRDGLQKIINRHTVKLSYSCMPNLKRIISGHNARVIKKSRDRNDDEPGCNCQRPDTCPLNGQCQIRSIVYKATITTECPADSRVYIGGTDTTFKMRHYGHASDLRVNKKEGGTELSRHVWKLREQGKDPEVRWEVLKRCQPYRSGKRVCDVCNTEKLQILRHMGPGCVNWKSELNNKWRKLAEPPQHNPPIRPCVYPTLYGGLRP